MKTISLVLLMLLAIAPIMGQSSCNEKSNHEIKSTIISFEDTSQSGQIKYNLLIIASDSVYIDSLGLDYSFFDSFSCNSSFPVFLDSSDSVQIEITLYYDQNNLPFYYRNIDNYVFSRSDLNDSIEFTNLSSCNIYFTPYGTTEVWNMDDFSGLRRAWILPDTIEPSRVYISQDSIPVSDRVDLDSLHEEWEEHFQYVSYPGLPYMVEMKAIHPDSLKQFIMEYDEFIEDSINNSIAFSFAIAKRFRGTVRGRLTSDYINDLNTVVTGRIPLAGIHVILKANKRVRIGANNIFTNDNGEFEIDYNVVSFFDGDEIELYLEFETKNKFGTKVKRKGSAFEENPYVEVIELGSKEDQTLTEINDELLHFNGERSYPFRIASWTYLAYRFLEDNASSYLPDWDLKVKIYGNDGSFYRGINKNIILEEGDERHESVIWHEFGHYLMDFVFDEMDDYLQGNGGDHASQNEGNYQLAWSEGWASGFMAMLDVYYNNLDLETGIYAWVEGGQNFTIGGRNFIGRLAYESRTRVWLNNGLQSNGIRSEYHIFCVINDLFDGQQYFSGGSPNTTHNDNNTIFNGFDIGVLDDVSLSANDILYCLAQRPLSITDFFNELMLKYSSNCNLKRRIKVLFDQNDINVNTTSNLAIDALSSDIIGVGSSLADSKTVKILGVPFTTNFTTFFTLDREFVQDNGLDQNYNISKDLDPNDILLSDNLTIRNGGTLSFNKYIQNGWSFEPITYNGLPLANSNLKVNACPERINVVNDGTMEIGDPTNNTTSTVKILGGTRLILNTTNVANPSILIINEGSTLIIDEEAVLEFHPGAQIILDGPNAVLEIKGQIQIFDGATYTVSGGTNGLGYVKFFRNTNLNLAPLISSPTNDGIVELIGTGSTDKLIEIDGTEGLKINSDIVNFTLKQAKVLLGDRSVIEPNISGKVFFEQVDVDQLFQDFEHNGIRINGVKNEFHMVRVNGGNYGFVNTGLLIGNEKLNLRAVQITGCGIGIMTYSSGLNYLGGFIKGYSIAGWKSVGANVPSDITGVWLNNDQSNSGVFGVLLDGVNSAGSTTFTGSKFQNNTSGIQAWNVPVRLKSCNYFEANDIGIQMEAWSNLDLSNNSYTTFNGNDMHILSRFHGIMHMNDGHNGFLSSGNSSIFWASLQPGAQSPSVTYLTLAPTPENYYANNNLFQTTPSWGNNFYLDERGSRVLNLTTNNLYPNNNPSVWTSAQNNVCGTPDYETLEFTGSGGGLGQFITSKYSTLSGVTIPSGLEYGNNLLNVCSGLLDSLYMGYAPNYSSITCGLGHLARKTYSNSSPIMANLKLELLDHAIKAYAIGVSKNAIFVSEDSLSFASNCLLGTIDTLLIDANNDSLPWKKVKFNLSASKAEVLRIAKHRDDASILLNSALSVYTDSLETVYLNKWACIIEAEQAFIDSLVTLDSLYINFPCYGQEIEFSAPMPNSMGIDNSLDKKSELENAILIYPNPATEFLNIFLNHKQNIVQIIIYDLKGMIIYSSEVSEITSEFKIDLSSLNSGSYIISVITEQTVFHSPLVISK